MSELIERSFVGRVEYIRRWRATEGEQRAEVCVSFGGHRTEFRVLGDGSEWTPGQKVEVVLREVHDAD